MKIAWDASHQEFTIEDHYYFWKLKKSIIDAGGIVNEIYKLKEAREYDMLVINYPEKKFRFWEVRLLEKLMRKGLRVFILGYYRNEDRIADAVNSLTKKFGLILNSDEITDEINNFGGDRYIIKTTRILKYNKNVSLLMMPCTASVSILNKKAEIVLLAEDTAKVSSGNKPIIIAEVPVGKGKLIVSGTCSFWDNYGLSFGDNLQFAINILFNMV